MDESNKCRICLQNSEIRHQLDHRLNEGLVWEAINAIADVCVVLGDPYPQWICQNCSDLLQISLKFKRDVEISDKILHNTDFEYVPVIKSEEDEDPQETPEKSIYEPTVIIKSKRGRRIKQKSYLEDPKTSPDCVKFDESDSSDTQAETEVAQKPQRKSKKSQKSIEFQCCMCQTIFPTKDELISHVPLMHAATIEANLQKKFTSRQFHACSYCHTRFRSRRYLQQHFETPDYVEPPKKRTYKPKQKPAQNIVCTYCGKISADIYESRMHELRVHAEDCPIACEFPGCTKRFAARIIMKKHLRIHAEKTFVCDICGKAFQSEKYLLKHEFVHREEKPLKCSYCPKAFIHQNALKAHLEFHTSDKTWNCDQCEKTYKWKEDLQKHVRGVHLGDHPYKCKYCNKGYFCSSSRKYHQDRCQQSVLPNVKVS